MKSQNYILRDKSNYDEIIIDIKSKKMITFNKYEIKSKL